MSLVLLPVCPTVMLLPRPTPEVTVMVVPVLFTSVVRIPAGRAAAAAVDASVRYRVKPHTVARSATVRWTLLLKTCPLTGKPR